MLVNLHTMKFEKKIVKTRWTYNSLRLVNVTAKASGMVKPVGVEITQPMLVVADPAKIQLSNVLQAVVWPGTLASTNTNKTREGKIIFFQCEITISWPKGEICMFKKKIGGKYQTSLVLQNL